MNYEILKNKVTKTLDLLKKYDCGIIQFCDDIRNYDNLSYVTNNHESNSYEIESALTKLGYGIIKFNRIPDEKYLLFIINIVNDSNFYDNLVKLVVKYNTNDLFIRERECDVICHHSLNESDRKEYPIGTDVNVFVEALIKILKSKSDDRIYIHTYLGDTSFVMEHKSKIAKQMLEKANIQCSLTYEDYRNIEETVASLHNKINGVNEIRK